NCFYVNQYYNKTNLEAHYHSTGPKIWRQTGGLITHYMATCGTGGTISGAGRYLKEQNANVRVLAVDAEGSVLTKFHQTGILDKSEILSYQLEGVGNNIIPSNVDFDTIERFIKADDRSTAFWGRQLTNGEGIFVGY